MPITKSITRPLTHRLTRAINDAGAGGGAQLVAVPAGFGWTPPVNVYKEGSAYSTDYDPTPFLVEGAPGVTTYYVDSATGNDANPGTSALPKKSLTSVTGGRVTKLLIKARGKFYRDDGGYVQYGHDNLCVEAWGGAECVISKEAPPGYPLVWTDEGGGTWSAPSPYGIYTGMDVYLGTDVETLTPYAYAASLADCQATPGTRFRTTGPVKFWVHTLDGASPATGHTMYNVNGSAAVLDSSVHAFAQRFQYHGVSFLGGDTAFHVLGESAFNKTVEFVTCKFKRATQFAALHTTGSAYVVNYESEAGPSTFDGFSYTTVGASVPNGVEINCIGRNNGYVSTGANQGSTTHSGGKVLRVNCQYYDNANDQIADVGAGTGSWNLGCTFGPKGVGTGWAGVQCGNDGTDPVMWLDGCTFSGLDYDVGANNATATIYYKNMDAPSTTPSTTGTVTTY